VAIHPLVVAWNDDEGVPRALELAFSRLQPLVAAGTEPRGDVADVDHESQLLAVHLVDHAVENGGLGFVVRRIADQREGQRRAERGGEGRRNVRRAPGEQERENRG